MLVSSHLQTLQNAHLAKLGETYTHRQTDNLSRRKWKTEKFKYNEANLSSDTHNEINTSKEIGRDGIREEIILRSTDLVTFSFYVDLCSVSLNFQNLRIISRPSHVK